MLSLYSSRFSWMLLILGLCSVAAQADQSRYNDHLRRYDEQFQYRYVSLNKLLPPGFDNFDPVAINDQGRVFGTAYDYSNAKANIAVYADGAVTILQSGFARAANEKGIVGGYVDDPINYRLQAALFQGDKVKLVPFQRGETNSLVTALNDRGAALIVSSDSSGIYSIYSLYYKGQSLPLDLGPDFYPESINNQGIITGSIEEPFKDRRGFRFDPYTGETTVLNPLLSDSQAKGQDINNRGDVLGYSFIPDGRQRIGVWDRKGKFETYFIEGTRKFPSISGNLRFNDKNLIVITSIWNIPGEIGNSYLVPKSGVRLNVADLVENLPLLYDLNYIADINNHGSMVGFGTDSFLLERIKNRGH